MHQFWTELYEICQLAHKWNIALSDWLIRDYILPNCDNEGKIIHGEFENSPPITKDDKPIKVRFLDQTNISSPMNFIRDICLKFDLSNDDIEYENNDIMVAVKRINTLIYVGEGSIPFSPIDMFVFNGERLYKRIKSDITISQTQKFIREKTIPLFKKFVKDCDDEANSNYDSILIIKEYIRDGWTICVLQKKYTLHYYNSWALIKFMDWLSKNDVLPSTNTVECQTDTNMCGDKVIAVINRSSITKPSLISEIKKVVNCPMVHMSHIPADDQDFYGVVLIVDHKDMDGKYVKKVTQLDGNKIIIVNCTDLSHPFVSGGLCFRFPIIENFTIDGTDAHMCERPADMGRVISQWFSQTYISSDSDSDSSASESDDDTD